MLTSEKRKTRPLERNSLLGTDKGEPKGSTGELLPAAQKVSWRLCSVARRSRKERRLSALIMAVPSGWQPIMIQSVPYANEGLG
jgi:hypothetical protein